MMSGKPRFTGVRQRTIAVVAIIALGLTLTFILLQTRLLNQTNRQGEFSQRAAAAPSFSVIRARYPPPGITITAECELSVPACAG